MPNDNTQADTRRVVTSPAYLLRSLISSLLIALAIIAKFIPELLQDLPDDWHVMITDNWLLLVIVAIVLGGWNLMALKGSFRK